MSAALEALSKEVFTRLDEQIVDGYLAIRGCFIA